MKRDECEAALRSFAGLVLRWNARINLTSDTDPDRLWHRHILDCLQLVDYLPDGTDRLIDLGSGAGFPGLVLAIARPDVQVELVESDRRKTIFLAEAIRALGLTNARVVPERAETTRLDRTALLTARAFAPLVGLLPLVHRLLRPEGVALLPKGRRVEQELTDAAPTWSMRVERLPSRTDSDGRILRLSEISPVANPE